MVHYFTCCANGYIHETTKADSVRLLKAAIVTHRKDRRKELDDAYTSGVFSEPASEYYDLRDEWNNNPSVITCVSDHVHTLQYDYSKDSVKYVFDTDKPIKYFYNERPVSLLELQMYDGRNIAYIKILNSEFISTDRPVIKKTKIGDTPLGVYEVKVPLNVLIYSRDYYLTKNGKRGKVIYRSVD